MMIEQPSSPVQTHFTLAPTSAELPTGESRLVTVGRALERGMTLVEIMVVMAIIAIIGTAIAFGVIPALAGSQKDAAKAQIDTISKGLDTFYVKHREMPDNLEALVEEEYLKADQLLDPWKKPFTYEVVSARKFSLCSAGENKQPGDEDDICNDVKR